MKTEVLQNNMKGMAVLRIHEDYISINKKGCELLGLGEPEERVVFTIDKGAERNTVYIGKTSRRKGWPFYRKSASTYRINSKLLCRMIFNNLQGYGAYRICEEVEIRNVYDETCYEVFFEKLQ